MKRMFISIIVAFVMVVMSAPAGAANYNFDADNMGFVTAGYFDDGDITQIAGSFSSSASNWDATEQALVFTTGNTVPASPTSSGYVSMHFNKDVTSDTDWEDLANFTFEAWVDNDSPNLITFQPVVEIVKPDSTTTYWAGPPSFLTSSRQTFSMDLTGTPEGSDVTDFNFRFYFSEGRIYSASRIFLDTITSGEKRPPDSVPNPPESLDVSSN